MSCKSQRSLNWLLQQFQLKPGKPDITASLQTLVLVLVPIGVGVLIGHLAASATAVMPMPLPLRLDALRFKAQLCRSGKNKL